MKNALLSSLIARDVHEILCSYAKDQTDDVEFAHSAIHAAAVVLESTLCAFEGSREEFEETFRKTREEVRETVKGNYYEKT